MSGKVAKKTNEFRRILVERTLVSNLVGNAERFEEAQDLGVSTSWFKDPSSRIVYDTLQSFWRAHPGHVPNAEYLADHAVPYEPVLSDEPLTVTVSRLRDLYVASELEHNLLLAEQVARRSPLTALEQTLETLSNLAETANPAGREPSDDELTDNAVASYLQREQTGGMVGLPWPFTSLNELTGGIAEQSMVVLYGRKKSYKSTILFYVALCLAEEGRRVLLSSGELPRAQVREILLCMHARVPLDRYRCGSLTEEEKVRLFSARDTLKQLPLSTDKTPGKGLQELDLLARRAVKFGAEIVILDGVHLLPKTRDWQDVGNYADRVLHHALRGRAPWLVGAQANRSSRQLTRDQSFDLFDTDQDIGGAITWVQHCSQSIRVRKVADGAAELDLADNRVGHSRTIPIWVQPGVRICERNGT